MTTTRIDLSAYTSIVVLTGAGVSAESGLPTYRGAGGLWTQGDTAEVSQAEIVRTNPARMWEFFGSLRPMILEAQPNAAHIALSQAQSKLSASQSMTIITQNIDGLHQRAGSKQVVELHGSLFRTRCANEKCQLSAFDDSQKYAEPPLCKLCGSVLRPAIVLFGEALPPEAEHKAKRALRAVDLFIAIGTSGTVSPAADFVRSAKYMGAKTVLVNLDKADNQSFDQQIIGPAGTVLPQAFGLS
jgi:NAD-dependent deacetylase